MKEMEKMLRKAKKNVEEAEKEIARLENTKVEIEEKFANGETSDELFKRHAQVQRDLENAMSIWELAETELDELSAKQSK